MFSAQVSQYVLSGVILVCQHSPLAHLMGSWDGWSSHPGLAGDGNLLCTWHFPAKQIIPNELIADIKYFRRYFSKTIIFVYNYIYKKILFASRGNKAMKATAGTSCRDLWGNELVGYKFVDGFLLVLSVRLRIKALTWVNAITRV